MNPFEPGMVGAAGLNAAMCQHVAARGHRMLKNNRYPFFYNPMWSFFGDLSAGPPGTYYYDRAEHVNYFWNLFDQLLIRPALAHGFSKDYLRIVTEVNGVSLLDRHGKPDVTIGSDHLPLVFHLSFRGVFTVAANVPDLWGEIEPVAVRTPVSILKEQASLLYEKTNGLVKAEVSTTRRGGEFYHSFDLVVPALDGYTYELFRVHHGLDPYPLRSPTETGLEIKSEEAFRGWLHVKLSSPATKQIINKLIAHAVGANG